jgi:biopolymer transport protein ExbD
MITKMIAVDRINATHSKPQPGAIKEDAVRVSILCDGSLYFRNVRIRPDVLPNRLRDAALNRTEQKVYLLVDARSRYGDVQKVLAMIQLSGIHEISFLSY